MSVLFVTRDPVGSAMGGNAIRAFELARAVAMHRPVTLAAPAGDGSPPETPARLVTYDPGAPRALEAAVAGAEVVVAQPQGPLVAGWLRASGARLIYDLYDAAPFEALEIFAGRPRPVREWWSTLAHDHALGALRDGHHFLVANARQRDLWTGVMVGRRLVGPDLYDRDPGLVATLAEVPFGVPPEPPVAQGGGVRARFPELPADAEIVLWNGGAWNWMDPVTAVRAVQALDRPAARLVFMGRGPASGAASREYDAARRAAGPRVLFNDGWVPYEERAAWLLEASCAISTHADHLETRYAFRTRLLDCLWTGLPVVCTEGDDLGERVEREDLGGTAPAGDADAAAAALARVLDRGRAAYGEQLARAAADLAWDRVAEPLVRLLDGPVPPRLGDGIRQRLASPAASGRSVATRALRAARLALSR